MGNSVYLGDESGDTTGVTAGDGLSGGGTSGTVTLSLDSSVAGDGLAHSSGVLSLDANELTPATIDPASDSVIIIDASDSNATRKRNTCRYRYNASWRRSNCIKWCIQCKCRR